MKHIIAILFILNLTMAIGHFIEPGHGYNYEPIVTIVDIEWGLDTLQLMAWADDPYSTEIDGFISGRTIFYRYWDESEQTEGNITQYDYSIGTEYFNLSGFAQVSLNPPYQLSGGDEIGIFCDISINEDGSEMFCVGAGTIESVSISDECATPKNFVLQQNYPNPFNPFTTISYQIPSNSLVQLDVYNVFGQLVETLVNAKLEAGYHKIVWNATEFPSGIYFYQLTVGKQIIANEQMLLLK